MSYSDHTSETASLTVLRSILDRLPPPSLALAQDYSGATPFHVAIANGANHRLATVSLHPTLPNPYI